MKKSGYDVAFGQSQFEAHSFSICFWIGFNGNFRFLTKPPAPTHFNEYVFVDGHLCK